MVQQLCDVQQLRADTKHDWAHFRCGKIKRRLCLKTTDCTAQLSTAKRWWSLVNICTIGGFKGFFSDANESFRCAWAAVNAKGKKKKRMIFQVIALKYPTGYRKMKNWTSFAWLSIMWIISKSMGERSVSHCPVSCWSSDAVRNLTPVFFRPPQFCSKHPVNVWETHRRRFSRSFHTRARARTRTHDLRKSVISEVQYVSNW